MSRVDPKALFRDSENFSEFIDRFGFGAGHTFFMTVTFKNNLSKQACASAFNVFRTYLNKKSIRLSNGVPVDKPFHYISVWEEHKKGGWHLHLIGSLSGVSSSRLRAVARSFLSSTSTALGFINIKWTHGHDANGIKCYIFKYLSKGERKKGVRYINYSRNWTRRVNLPFTWLGGFSGDWRKACSELALNFPRSFRVFYYNSSHYLRTAVVTSWMQGHFKTAVVLLKSFGYRVFDGAFCLDLIDVMNYFNRFGGFVHSRDDSSVREFFTFGYPYFPRAPFKGYIWEDQPIPGCVS